MTFDEWLDERIREMEQFKVPHTLRLLKLVRAQGKMIDKLFARLGQEPGSVIVLGPNARKLADEIDMLEAALMGQNK